MSHFFLYQYHKFHRRLHLSESMMMYCSVLSVCRAANEFVNTKKTKYVTVHDKKKVFKICLFL